MFPHKSIVWLIVSLCCNPVGGRGFSWTKTVENAPADSLIETSSPGFRLSADASTIIEKAARFEGYNDAHRPDCFRRVAGALRVHCGELEVDEGERIRAAIAMTLCELATANHSPPLECNPFTIEGQSPEFLPRASLNACVGALSRSAQYWSSYSGYLREAPQLCYAYRRWHDIDTAKDTYRNATLEVLSLLQVLQTQAEDTSLRQSQVDDILQRTQTVLADMGIMERELSQVTIALSESVKSVSAEAATIFRGMLAELQESHAQAGRRAGEEMSLNLELTAQEHAATLSALLTTFQRALNAEASAMFAGAAVQYQALQEQADLSVIQWQSFRSDVRVLQQSIERLLSTSTEAAAELAVYASQAAVARRVQQESTDSAAHLALVLAELANRTRDEMSAINETAAAVRGELTNTSRYHASIWDAPWVRGWAEYGLMWLLQTVSGGNRTNLDVLLQLPAFRAGWFCLQVAWYLLRIGFSTVLGTLLLVLSLRKWLPTTLCFRTMSLGDIAKACDAQGPLVSEAGTPVYSCPRAPTFALLPSRSAYLVARAAPDSAERHRQRRFSRIPDRLCAARSESCAS